MSKLNQNGVAAVLDSLRKSGSGEQKLAAVSALLADPEAKPATEKSAGAYEGALAAVVALAAFPGTQAKANAVAEGLLPKNADASVVVPEYELAAENTRLKARVEALSTQVTELQNASVSGGDSSGQDDSANGKSKKELQGLCDAQGLDYKPRTTVAQLKAILQGE